MASARRCPTSFSQVTATQQATENSPARTRPPVASAGIGRGGSTSGGAGLSREEHPRDAGVAQLPDRAVEDEVVQVHGGGDQQARGRPRTGPGRRRRGEGQGGQDPDGGPRQQDLAHPRAPARVRAVGGAGEVARDPEVLDAVGNRDPQESGGRAQRLEQARSGQVGDGGGAANQSAWASTSAPPAAAPGGSPRRAPSRARPGSRDRPSASAGNSQRSAPLGDAERHEVVGPAGVEHRVAAAHAQHAVEVEQRQRHREGEGGPQHPPGAWWEAGARRAAEEHEREAVVLRGVVPGAPAQVQRDEQRSPARARRPPTRRRPTDDGAQIVDPEEGVAAPGRRAPVGPDQGGAVVGHAGQQDQQRQPRLQRAMSGRTMASAPTSSR